MSTTPEDYVFPSNTIRTLLPNLVSLTNITSFFMNFFVFFSLVVSRNFSLSYYAVIPHLAFSIYFSSVAYHVLILSSPNALS